MPFFGYLMFDYVIEHSSIIIWRLSLKLAKIGKRHPKKKMKLLAQNICLEKKGRRLPNSPKWRPKRPITLRCEKMPKKARGEVLSLIILIRPRTFWSSHAALLFQNYQFFCTNLILELYKNNTYMSLWELEKMGSPIIWIFALPMYAFFISVQ